MNNFIISLEVESTNKKNVQATLSIQNTLAKDCFIPEDAIMLNGFKNDKFVIFNQEHEEIAYQGKIVKYYPKMVQIKEDQTLVHELNLSDVYEFSEGNEYSIVYQTGVQCCSDIERSNCSPLEIIEAKAFIGNIYDESEVQ